MKTIEAVPLSKRIDWRANIFRVVAVLVALFMLAISITGILAPWGILPSSLGTNLQEGQNAHDILWYAAIWVAYASIFSSGTLMVLIWKPRANHLLMQFWLIVTILVNILFTVTELPEFDPTTWIVPIILLIAYPEPRELFRFKHGETWNKVFLGLGVVTLLAFAPVFWKNLQLFFSSESIQDMSIGPLQTAYIALIVPMAAFLIATNKPGWKPLSFITGILMLYLGLAAVTVPGLTGSWGLAGGLLSLAGGLLFIFTPMWMVRITKARQD